MVLLTSKITQVPKITALLRVDVQGLATPQLFALSLGKSGATKSTSPASLEKRGRENGNDLPKQCSPKGSAINFVSNPSIDTEVATVPICAKSVGMQTIPPAPQLPPKEADASLAPLLPEAMLKPEDTSVTPSVMPKLLEEVSKSIHRIESKRPQDLRKGNALEVDMTEATESNPMTNVAVVTAIATMPSMDSVMPAAPKCAVTAEPRTDQVQTRQRSVAQASNLLAKAADVSHIPNANRSFQDVVSAVPAQVVSAKGDGATAKVTTDSSTLPGASAHAAKFAGAETDVSATALFHRGSGPQSQDDAGLSHNAVPHSAAARLAESPVVRDEVRALDGNVIGSHKGNAVLAASANSLEVGVRNGAHGWLKIRAAFEDGLVTASLSATSSGGRDMLHRELPSLTAFMQKENLVVGSLVVAENPSTDLRGAMASNTSHRESSGSGNSSHANRSEPSTNDDDYQRSGDADYYLSDMMGGAGAMPLFTRSSGGWLSVQA